jgi:hypothetical protein
MVQSIDISVFDGPNFAEIFIGLFIYIVDRLIQVLVNIFCYCVCTELKIYIEIN